MNFRNNIAWMLMVLVLIRAQLTEAQTLVEQPLPLEQLVKKCRSLLDSGDLVLFQQAIDGTFRQATVIARLQTSASNAYALIADPNNYPRMSPSVDFFRVDLLEPTRAEFSSTVRVPFGSIENRVEVFFHPPAMIESHFIGGDLKTGRFRWEFIPETAQSSYVAYTVSTDVRESGWVVKKMVEAHPEFQYGGNAGTGLVTVWGLKRLIAGTAAAARGASPWADRSPDFPDRLSNDPAQNAVLLPLLEKGPVVHIESTASGRLCRSTVFAAIASGLDPAYRLVSDPLQYKKFIPGLLEVKVRESQPTKIRYETTLEILVFRYTQEEELVLPTHDSSFVTRIEQRVISGDLVGSGARFEFLPLAGNRTLCAFSSYLDPTRTGWVMRKIYELDPVIEHILSLSGGTNILLGLNQAAKNPAGNSP